SSRRINGWSESLAGPVGAYAVTRLISSSVRSVAGLWARAIAGHAAKIDDQTDDAFRLPRAISRNTSRSQTTVVCRPVRTMPLDLNDRITCFAESSETPATSARSC